MTSGTSPTAPLNSIFASLAGTWTLHRRLTSSLPYYPSGNFTGTATFTPHHSFSGSSYLYHETGSLATDTGLTLRANQRYIYVHNRENEKLSIWFTKSEGKSSFDALTAPEDEEIDYLYMELEMEWNGAVAGWKGVGDHLCELDLYSGLYDFRVQGEREEMTRFGIQYRVKGPEKDYLSETAFVKR